MSNNWTVTIVLERRDGCLYVSSDDIPGFFLSGADEHAVIRDIIPAIEALYLSNKQMRVRARFPTDSDCDDGTTEIPVPPPAYTRMTLRSCLAAA